MTTHRFISIKDSAPNVGAVIKLAVFPGEDDPSLLSPTQNERLIADVIKATVVGVDSKDFTKPYWLGWLEGEQYVHGAGARSSVTPPGTNVFADIDRYYRFLWASWDWLVQASVSTGMKCQGKHCSEFNPWAVPNMPDGRYLCFSCRQRPPYMT